MTSSARNSDGEQRQESPLCASRDASGSEFPCLLSASRGNARMHASRRAERTRARARARNSPSQAAKNKHGSDIPREKEKSTARKKKSSNVTDRARCPRSGAAKGRSARTRRAYAAPFIPFRARARALYRDLRQTHNRRASVCTKYPTVFLMARQRPAD